MFGKQRGTLVLDDAAPIVEKLVRLSATRHHGMARSCAKSRLSDVRSPLLHRMVKQRINLMSPNVLTHIIDINRHSAVWTTVLLFTLEQYPWKGWRGCQSQNTCPCGSAFCASNPHSQQGPTSTSMVASRNQDLPTLFCFSFLFFSLLSCRLSVSQLADLWYYQKT